MADESKTVFEGTDLTSAHVERLRADGYTDLLADTPRAGKLWKKVLRAGSTEGPEKGCPCRVQYVGRLLDGRIFDSSRDVVGGKHVGGTDDPLRFALGRGEVVTGFDAAVASMTKGELSDFVMASELAYGRRGFDPKVAPGDALDFEIELLDWDMAVPRLPTQEEIARNREKRAKEAEELAASEPTIEERVEKSEAARQKGNKLVGEKEFKAAKEAYDEAFVHVYFGTDELASLSTEHRALVDAAKLPLYLNRALCNLHFHDWMSAEWDCKKALELDPGNVKATFRRGLMYLGELQGMMDRELEGEFWDPDRAAIVATKARADLLGALERTPPTQQKAIKKAIRRLKVQQERLKAERARYRQAQTKLFRGKIMAGLERQNAELDAAEQARVLEEARKSEAEEAAAAAAAAAADDDMPDLEDF